MFVTSTKPTTTDNYFDDGSLPVVFILMKAAISVSIELVESYSYHSSSREQF